MIISLFRYLLCYGFFVNEMYAMSTKSSMEAAASLTAPRPGRMQLNAVEGFDG